MLHDLQSDLLKVAFGPEEMVGDLNRLRWP